MRSSNLLLIAEQGGEAGAMDEEQFRDAFGDYIKLQISSGNEVEAEMTKVKNVLDNPKADWEKRIEQVFSGMKETR